jgi:hypothetical protein
LEIAGWMPRVPLSDAVWIDRWQERDGSDSLLKCLSQSGARLME